MLKIEALKESIHTLRSSVNFLVSEMKTNNDLLGKLIRVLEVKKNG